MALARLAASLARPLTSSLPLLSACRTILTVNVHAPSAQSGNDLRTEIKRYEEIAASRINRMVQTEIRLGTLPPAPRRMKRYSRFTKPKEQRRLAGACTPEGVGRALLPGRLRVPAGLAPWQGRVRARGSVRAWRAVEVGAMVGSPAAL